MEDMENVLKNEGRSKGGRPSLYSDALAEKIVELIAEGFSERQIASMEGMPCTMTMRRWKDAHPDFLARSAQARKESADLFNDRRMEKAKRLYEEAMSRLESGEGFPRGVVEAVKASMQEDAREAAIRDDSRYGDRKRVALETPPQSGGGLKDFYDGVLRDLRSTEEPESGS